MIVCEFIVCLKIILHSHACEIPELFTLIRKNKNNCVSCRGLPPDNWVCNPRSRNSQALDSSLSYKVLHFCVSSLLQFSSKYQITVWKKMNVTPSWSFQVRQNWKVPWILHKNVILWQPPYATPAHLIFSSLHRWVLLLVEKHI